MERGKPSLGVPRADAGVRLKLVAVIQARMGSSRLPGKILLPLQGKPLLERMIERVRAASALDDIIVATTTDPADDPIRALCRRIDIPIYSGHPTDLLDRHYQAARERGADGVAKIPSDCPLIDPRIIDRVVNRFKNLTASPGIDFVSNLHPASYPDGNDVEIMPLPILETAWREASRGFEREHTTPFIWDQPGRFRMDNMLWESGRDLSMSHRFTIDYPEDYAFIEAVFNALHVEGGNGTGDSLPFSMDDILRLLEKRPDIFRINAHLAGVNWYRLHLGELRTVNRSETVLLGET